MTSPECGFELYFGFFFIHFGAVLALKVFLDVLERDYFGWWDFWVLEVVFGVFWWSLGGLEGIFEGDF